MYFEGKVNSPKIFKIIFKLFIIYFSLKSRKSDSFHIEQHIISLYSLYSLKEPKLNELHKTPLES